MMSVEIVPGFTSVLFLARPSPMPRLKRRGYLILFAITAMLFLAAFYFLEKGGLWSVRLDDGSKFVIMDVATAPKEELYVGLPEKRLLGVVLKPFDTTLKKNFGYFSATNESAITWVMDGPATYGFNPLDFAEKVRLVDASGAEHQTMPLFCFPGSPNARSGAYCGLFVFDASLKAPAYLQFRFEGRTNEFRVK